MRILTPALITLIMLIVVGGLIAAYIGKTIFFQPQPAAAAPETRLVPMASADIPAGTLITANHLVNGPIRRDKMQRETILNSTAIVGRYTLKDIKQAQPILTSDLYAPSMRPPLQMKEDMVALTVGLGDSTSVVDGLIKPGDFVDVHLTLDDNPADKRYRGGFTMTMLKGVRVLAMNRLTQQADVSRGANTVTFELTPEQSNIVLEAKKHGQLTISYNPKGEGSGGVEVAASDRAYFEEILGLPPIPEREKPFLTEIYRGPMRSLINYDDEEEWDDNGSATPWIEQPGWAPPRNGGYGRGGYRGQWNGRGGYRGTQMENGNPENGGNSGSGNPSLPAVQSRANGGQNPAA